MTEGEGRRAGGAAAAQAARIADRASEVILVVVLLAVPATLGGVLPWARGALVAGGAALLALAGVKALLDRREPSPVPLAVVAPILALAALALLSGVPLPQGVADAISPEASRHRAALASGAAPPATLSLAPWLAPGAAAFGVAFLGVLLAAAGSRADAARRKRVAAALVATGAITAAIGIAQRVAGISDRVLFALEAPPGSHPFGPYVNRNHFAGLVAAALPLALGLSLSVFRKVFERLDRASIAEILAAASRSTLGRAISLLALAAAMLGAILLSGSRGGLFAAVVGLAPVVAAAALGRGAVRSGVAAVLIAGVLAVSAGLFFWVDPDTLPSRFRDPVESSLRVPLWKDSFSILSDFQATGVGPGAFAVVYPSRQTFPAPFRFPYAESDLVCFAVERGAAGLLLLAAIVAASIARVLKGLKDMPASRRYLLLGAAGGALALAVHGIYDFNGHLPGNGLVLAAALGLALSLAESRGGPSPRAALVRSAPADRPRGETPGKG